MISRRQFINCAIASIGSATLSGPLLFGKEAQQPYLTFDLHSHPGLQFNQGHTAYAGGESSKTASEMNAGGLTGAFFSLVADAPLIAPSPNGVISTGDYAKGEGWKEYKRQV